MKGRERCESGSFRRLSGPALDVARAMGVLENREGLAEAMGVRWNAAEDQAPPGGGTERWLRT
jgi:hypothetical protein